MHRCIYIVPVLPRGKSNVAAAEGLLCKGEFENGKSGPKLNKILLYPRHTKYVGVYSFRFSVRPFVRTFVRSYVRSFVRSFVFPSQGQSFCVKVYKTSYFEDPLMDFDYIWHDGRYRSKVFISTIPTPG